MITVIFDMDGVIFDTESLCLRCWRTIAPDYQIADVTGMFLKCVGTNKDGTRRIIRSTQGADFPTEEFLARASELFHQIAEREGLPLKPGIRALLAFLQEHRIPVGLASSTRMAVIEQALTASSLRSCFSVLIGGDMVSEGKPSPEIYQKACDALQADPDRTYAIEDSPNGIRSAYAAGLKPIMVPDLIPPTPEMEQKSVAILSNLSEVQDYFSAL